MSATSEDLRQWIGAHIWDEDDFGGFTECPVAKAGRTREEQVTANVKELLDLAAPDWRDWTAAAQDSRRAAGEP